MKKSSNKYLSTIKNILIFLLICFFCSGCNNIENLNNFKNGNNIKEEKIFDINKIINANSYEELMKIYGSIYIEEELKNINGDIVEVKNIYEDEKGNILYRNYKADCGYDLKDSFYNIKIDNKWYVATDKNEVGEDYNLTDELKASFEEYNCIQKFNGDDYICSENEYVLENYIDENGEGVFKTSVSNLNNNIMKDFYKNYGINAGIEKLSKIIFTYTYDVDTNMILTMVGTSIDEKGRNYIISYTKFSYGEGQTEIMQNVNEYKNYIKNYDYIVSNNTYDMLLKKYNSVKVNLKLENDYNTLLTYDVYGDFRGIKSFKSWDYTINTTNSLAYTHIRDASGNWYKTNNGKTMTIDNVLTAGEKDYYEVYNPIEGFFSNKSLIINKQLVKSNLVSGDIGHLICETDKLVDILKGYRKSVIEDLDFLISNIKIDYEYDIKDYVIKNIIFDITKKDGARDRRMISVDIDYNIDCPKYGEALFYDKKFKMNYYDILDANMEKNIFNKNNVIKIIDKKYDAIGQVDREINLIKNKNGDFIIKDDKGNIYIKNIDGTIYIEKNGIKTKVDDVEKVDVYVRNVFENDNIVSAFYNDNNINSFINENEEIVVCYNDLGVGRLITTNEDKNVRIEYKYNLYTKVVEEIVYYDIKDYKMIKKYETTIDVS